MPRLAIIDQVVSAGGVERFLHGLVQGLLELPEIKGWDITILLNRYNSGGYVVKWPEHLTGPNVQVHYLCDDRLGRILNRLARGQRIWGIPGTARAQRAIPWSLRRYGSAWLRKHAGDARLWIEDYCAKQQFDVAYFAYPYLMGCPSIPMPLVATPHDFNYKRFSTLGSVLRAQIDRQMPEWLRRCRVLVVSSEFIASELRHFYPEAAARVRVIRPGIPSVTRVATPVDLEAYRQRMGLPEQFLLTTGWVVPHKNQEVLFDALGLLRQRGLGIPLVCVGPNSDQLQASKRGRAHGYVAELLKSAERLGLKSGRDFFGLGYVRDFELECLYRLASALVMPSLYEAGSFPALEATRAMCPVACSQIPAHIEQAGLLGHNIWLFDPHDPENLADTVEQMLKDIHVTAECAGRASGLVGQVYSWQNAAAGYLYIFKEVLQAGGGDIPEYERPVVSKQEGGYSGHV